MIAFLALTYVVVLPLVVLEWRTLARIERMMVDLDRELRRRML